MWVPNNLTLAGRTRLEHGLILSRVVNTARRVSLSVPVFILAHVLLRVMRNTRHIDAVVEQCRVGAAENVDVAVGAESGRMVAPVGFLVGVPVVPIRSVNS